MSQYNSVMDVAAVVGLIQQAAEAASQEIRFVAQHVVGKVAARQGDIYLHMVAASHPHGGRVESRQLAQGETQGSRHMIEEANVRVYEGTTLPPTCRPGTFLGPCFDILGVDHRTNTHPQHAHNHLPPGRYQVTHQMDARSLMRVQD